MPLHIGRSQVELAVDEGYIATKEREFRKRKKQERAGELEMPALKN